MVAVPIFKIEVLEDLGQAGSIPVHLRPGLASRASAGYGERQSVQGT